MSVSRRRRTNRTRSNINRGVENPDPKQVLTVQSLDLKIQENTKAHQTNMYDLCSPSNRDAQLIVRRGQSFNIDIHFSKEYDPTKDNLRLIFEAGDTPLKSKGTSVMIHVAADDKPRQWGAKIISKRGTTLSVQVFTPPACYVGPWDLSVQASKKDNNNTNLYTYEHEDPIYIIFNPMNKDDIVYMGDENKRREYVFNETGLIYAGDKNYIDAKPWNFGQFERYVFEAVMFLLDNSEMKWVSRGDAVKVVRKISALVNSQDEGGVLVGNWSGDYSEGRSPLSWTGSAAILKEYYTEKYSVRFGQCWVFSGLSTTVCRALGIPCRSVTNFSSAHDSDATITLDVHFTADGIIDNEKSEKIWNFHVWNEAWMARPDLPAGYGGWQAFDSTPQELSDDMFQCGPVSVQAIKQGVVNLPFDAPFVFAEVNADVCHWVQDDFGKLTCNYIETDAVGKYISTKAPNVYEREDLTLDYKQKEGTPEEITAVLAARDRGAVNRDIEKKPQDIKFSTEHDAQGTFMGGAFELNMLMRNDSNEKRTVSGRIHVMTMLYTGVTKDTLRDEPLKSLVLNPGQDIRYKVVVEPEEYIGKLKTCCMLDLTIWAVVHETKQHFTSKESFRFRKPTLTVKASKEAVVGKEFKVEVSFQNPLNIWLTKCFVAIGGLTEELKFPQKNVRPKGTFTTTLSIKPERSGQRDLIIVFNSEELEDVNAFHEINIRGA